MIALLFSAAWAGPCDDDVTGIPTGPVTVGFLDGDLGVAHRLCGRTEAALHAGGRAVVEPTNFYGHIVAGGTLEGSWAATERTEVYATVEAFRYDSVIAPISTSYAGFGHVGLGVAQRFVDAGSVGVGAHARLVLPTAIGLYRNAYPAAGVRATVGAEWHPVRPFALVADLDAGFGYTDPVDVVAAEVALRGGIGKRVGLELAAAYPLLGRERALAAAELRVDVRLGKAGQDATPAEPAVPPSSP